MPYGFDDRVLTLYTAALEDAGDDAEMSAPYPARVSRVERSACFAVGPDGVERPLQAATLPAVGDWVVAADDAVREILPRWTRLTRMDPGGEQLQTLAADVDLVAVVTPADRSSAARVERELTIAFDSGAVPLVVVTKADLATSELAASLAKRLSGVDVLEVSAATGAGIAQLRDRIRAHGTVVLIGPSGAGKSTLANALLEAELLTTGAVRSGDARGRHTTTSRQLVAIPGGGVLIDTPGLRGLAMHGDVEVGASFPDVTQLAAECRFADCSHRAEPGCSVRDAVADGTLDPDRLKNFFKLELEAAAEPRRPQSPARRDHSRIHQARARQIRAQGKYRPS